MYYGGLDLGTSSVGWALTDENYRLIRKKGKDLWGVRMFDEANPAQERRKNRVSRRRRARETARIGLVKEYFAEAVNKVDAGFYQRLEESKYHYEDKEIACKFALFADADFTDKEYYAKYPTIFHLRKELLESTEEHDVRLVYLAVLNLFKRRGHFLNAGMDDANKKENLSELYQMFWNSLPEDLDLKFPESVDLKKIEEILGNREHSRNENAERLAELLEVTKNSRKAEYELIKMMCGLSGRLAYIFKKDIPGEDYGKKQLSFRSCSYEEEINALSGVLTDEYMELLEAAKAIHDKGMLIHILKGHEYLSQARTASYEKHKIDLEKLRKAIKTYCPDEYDEYFRIMKVNNYSGYVGSVNSGKEKCRRERNARKDNYKEFWNNTKRILQKMPETDEDVIYLRKELEKETLFPKQLTFENGIIPNQVHLKELKKILGNAEQYLDFLTERDESGFTVTERLIQLYQFQIPYYVGPLYRKDGKEDGKWVERKETGKVLPWNLEQKVDLAKTREAFMIKMVRHCSYLSGKNVLPKYSLMYESYMVLNELNNVRIHGEKLSVELKQDIYRELFMTGKKVTGERLAKYLRKNGKLAEGEEDAVSGIDGNFSHTLTSWARFTSVLGEKMQLFEYQKMAEQIIFWGTVYSNDRKLMKELITKEYGDQSEKKWLDEDKIKRILGYKWKDWGRMSKEFLELPGCAKADGAVLSLIRAMWETDCNLNELLSDKFTFIDTLHEQIKEKEKLLTEFSYEDLNDSYLSVPVKRMIWQTVLILKELCQVMGEPPQKLFIEMPRKKEEKEKRTISRKKKLEDLYKKESKEWLEAIGNYTEDEFRSKKLYLYYMQKGRCMYTGNEIVLEDLLRNNDRYDIDHIYPRHFVKDDSIDNNLVLVEKQSNGHKSDHFPIERQIQQDRNEFWKALRKGGFITEEKYRRLTRSWGFSEEELAGFINRQIVETGQATKYVAHLLENLLPDTEIVYVKAGNVSDFRHKYDLLKSRVVNDFHHAQDAYLNIVVGNVYHTKFTKNPLNFISEYRKDNKKERYHMDKLFQFDVERNGVTAWRAGGNGTVVVVKGVMNRNTPLITKRTFEQHGGLADQTVYSAKEAKAQGYIPVKTSDKRLSDVTKYGGFSSVTGAYYFLVEHEKKRKRVRTLEQMPLYLKERLEKDEQELVRYCEDVLGLEKPDIRMRKIPMRALVKRDGFFLRIGGKTNNQLYAENAVSLCLNRRWINYIKRLENFKEYGKSADVQGDKEKRVSKENNEALYRILMEKHRDGIYKNKPNSLGERLAERREKFDGLEVKDQVHVLLELLKITQCQNMGMKLKDLLDLSASPNVIGKEITRQDEFLLINQSVTGIYTSTIDLKTI